METSEHRKHPAVRLSADLLGRVDRYARQLEADLHISVSRTDAVHRLLVLGLEDAEDIRDGELALEEEGGVSLAAVKAEYGL